MFIDARDLDQGQHIEADVCIIGAGAAGIAYAREFIGTSTTVALLEAGGLNYDKKAQSLYDGDNIGLPSFGLAVNRLRYFGGTTGHWAGHCRPLDAIDFEQRDWLPHSGWPVTRSELDPYYLRSQPIVGLTPYEYENLEFWQKQLGMPDLDLDEERLITAVYNQSPPTRFGTAYRQELKDASNITVYLNANVLEIKTNDNATQVTALKVACIDGPEFPVSARIYILATGGMENARLLLLSDSVASSGLGNDNGLVGRYFMDHILLRPGADISFSDPRINLQLYQSLHKVEGATMFGVLASSDKLLRREKINNFRIHLVRTAPRNGKPVGRIFSNIDAVAGAEKNWLDDLPVRKKGKDTVALHLVLEPVPNPDSRITLSRKIDIFGQRKLNVNWQTVDKDVSNAYRSLELAALEFGRLGIGRAYGEIFKDSSQWPDNLEAGRHHCGTTRMTDNPQTGVVDKDCKMNSVSNLFVTGSSLFPTIGYANPTLTIIALALRLADHTKSLLKETNV